ncbi:related to RRP9-protein associated with the U3 small nucleolar RNA [Ustilago bromivora]|uniref:Related to RRP9 - protein associated with the U3 small nucleolar RNA n=1 Tax=Ustilago bromivora TaxID=307758 RepID=A0A1K0GCF2_9BASI|nr:related to RRP9-protein associated with the U3 small nucleolar RNA [Ustilago bromivora]SYW76735.1 related to RRP9 - protein associated with the U3 small nucleolar RNA [Ustilago bromivora]
MPDAFFQKKRKRSTGGASSSSSFSTAAGSSSRAGPSRAKPSSNSSSRMRKGGKHAASDSDDSDDNTPGGGIDEMDLTHNYNPALNSDEEAEAAETPAEARVRLAKMYLQGLSSNNNAATAGGEGGGDDFFESAEAPTFGLADAAQADRDNIAARLQKDVAEQSGRLHIFLANRVAPPHLPSNLEEEEVEESSAGGRYENSILAVRGHRLSVTSAVASSDAKWLFTASKDGTIIRWRLKDGKLIRILPKRSKHLDENGDPIPPTSSNKSKSSGAARRRARLTKSSSTNNPNTYVAVGADAGHTDEIWSLSLSSDNTYLASGGKDNRVCIWSTFPSASNPEKFLKSLGGHKDSITALSFRSGSHELYTASLDRTLKLYDVSQLSYIETLFGHQESILSLSCLSAETAVSAGGRDRTCRYWKIRDESQLVFRAGIKSKLRQVLEGGELNQEEAGKMSNPHEAMEGSVEVVSMIDTHHFLSGGDSGNISLWNLGKKKPIFSVPVAHGFQTTLSETEGEIRTPRWITSLAALAYSDLFVSGSWDGQVKLWGLTSQGGQVKGFRQLFSLPIPGVINSLQLVSPPLTSVRVDEETGAVRTTAIAKAEWKRKQGLNTNLASQTNSKESEEEETAVDDKKLDRLRATKDNCPPILIIGVGQEHKFGRWIKLGSSDQGKVRNGAVVIPLELTRTAQHESQGNGNGRKAGFKLV